MQDMLIDSLWQKNTSLLPSLHMYFILTLTFSVFLVFPSSAIFNKLWCSCVCLTSSQACMEIPLFVVFLFSSQRCVPQHFFATHDALGKLMLSSSSANTLVRLSSLSEQVCRSCVHIYKNCSSEQQWASWSASQLSHYQSCIQTTLCILINC